MHRTEVRACIHKHNCPRFCSTAHENPPAPFGLQVHVCGVGCALPAPPCEGDAGACAGVTFV